MNVSEHSLTFSSHSNSELSDKRISPPLQKDKDY